MGRQRYSSRRSSLAKTVNEASYSVPGDVDDAGKVSLTNATELSSDGTVGGTALSGGAGIAMTSIAGSGDDVEHANSGHVEVDVDVDDSDYGCDTMTLYPGRRCYRSPSTNGTSAYMFHSTSTGPYSDRAASTRSLWARELDYRDIGGRRYCKEYFMPNDEFEQLRLTIQHQVFMHAFDGELTLAPLEEPTHVLDVGTGTGDWAIRFAELFPDCEVIGTDISAIQETRGVPMNVFFEIDDAEEWDRPSDCYDLVHIRCMEGAFRDWRCIYDDVFDSLKPGGWIQVADFDGKEGCYHFFSDFPSDSGVFQMMDAHFAGAEASGRKRGMFHLDPQYFLEAGFVDIKVSDHSLRMDLHNDPVGKLWLMVWLDGIEAYCLRTLVEHMGWDVDVVKTKCREIALEISRRAQDTESCKTMVLKMHTVLARKPFREESPAATNSSSDTTLPGEDSN